jgi:hypothetical protein
MNVLPYSNSQPWYMIGEGKTLTRTHDARRGPGQARVGVVGRKAAYKDRTSPDITSCRRHASCGLDRYRRT